MELVIDIGNSLTKVGIFSKDDLISVQTVENFSIEFINNLFSDFPQINTAILSSVKEIDPAVNKYLRSLTKLIELDHKMNLPFINKYGTPDTLGLDRIAAVAGGLSLMPEKNVLVIDAGTCITYDLLTAEKNYLGGGISPGIKMRFNALNNYTDKLPLIRSRFDEEIELIGNSTECSILSGVQNGILGEVDGIIDQYKKRFSGLITIVTGGDYKYFDKYLKNNIFAAPNLVLIGLKKILEIDEDS